MDRQKFRKVFTLASVAAMTFVSLQNCRDNGTGLTYSFHDLRTIIPLKVGASWTYRQISYQDIPPFAETTSVTKKIISSIDSLSETYYLVQETYNNNQKNRYFETVNANTY